MNTMPELSANLQFLLNAVRWRVKPRAPTESCVLSADDEDVILMLAQYHNLIPWLWYYLDENSLGSGNLRKRVANQMRKESLVSQLQSREVVALSSALAKQNIQHLVFKGVTVQALFYRGFVEQRYCDDIDLLIAPQDLLASANVFTEHGYALRESQDVKKLADFLRQYSTWYRWRDIGWQKSNLGRERLDLHWRIADSFTLPADTHDLLNSSDRVRVNNADIPCLPFTTLFVYVCVHGHMDHFFRLRYLVDIYCAMHQPGYEPEKVTRLAKEWGVLDVVTQSIDVVNRFFGHSPSVPDTYSEFVVTRFNDSHSFPARSRSLMGIFFDLFRRSNDHRSLTMNPQLNQKVGGPRDRVQRLVLQMRHRSRNKSWLSPIIARCKYDQAMLEHWSTGASALVRYPIALIKRCFK